MSDHIHNPEKDSRIPKGFFSEEEALVFAEFTCNCFPKGVMYRWFWLGFQALQKAGLTYYETDHQEMSVRLRVHFMTLVFYEYCHKVNIADTDAFQSWNEEFLMELFRDLYDEDLDNVHEALIAYFKSAENLETEMWALSQEGRFNILIPRHLTELETSQADEERSKGYRWFYDHLGHISDFECMQSFSHDYALKKRPH